MRMILATLLLAGTALAQEKAAAPSQVPVQGPPPKNLTKFPDGHFSANTEPKDTEKFEVRTVVAGDTLSGIAADVLKDGKLWPQIWEQNEHIVNPHWIYPKDKILIRPVTIISEAKPPEPAPAPAPAVEPTPAPAPAPAPQQARPVERPPYVVPPYPASEPPKGPTVVLDLAPPRSYPEVKQSDLYCSGFIRASDVSHDMAVVGRYANHEIMSGAGDYVYIDRGTADGVRTGATYEVVRPTKKLNGLGTHYLEVAQVEIVMGQSDHSLARVTQGCEAVELGDLLIPFAKSDFPTLPANRSFSGTMQASGQVPGKIVTTKSALINSGSQYSNGASIPPATGSLQNLNAGVTAGNGVVYIDVGKAAGVKPGDLFIVFRDVVTGFGTHLVDREKGKRVREAVGEIVILKVEDKASTALVTYSADTISLGDVVERR